MCECWLAKVHLISQFLPLFVIAFQFHCICGFWIFSKKCQNWLIGGYYTITICKQETAMDIFKFKENETKKTGHILSNRKNVHFKFVIIFKLLYFVLLVLAGKPASPAKDTTMSVAGKQGPFFHCSFCPKTSLFFLTY